MHRSERPQAQHIYRSSDRWADTNAQVVFLGSCFEEAVCNLQSPGGWHAISEVPHIVARHIVVVGSIVHLAAVVDTVQFGPVTRTM